MGKKTKSKARLDKYYRIAKEQGYRSRAAFKLIQLNRKYNFLSTANSLVDLCAAPGGWLQVASKYMPVSSVKIGIDLVAIKHIPGVITFQEDITSARCLALIKKEIKNDKVDAVLHDGAPNVGSNWNKDAYTQSELVLASLKTATTILRKGGTFVTKVFRSTDYNSLIWVFNKFFEKVEATKPLASRNQSAEIFVVCLRYIAPDYIDPKLFDSKFVFKDTETDIIQNQSNNIESLDKLLEKRRHRQGYDDDAPVGLHRTIKFEDFLHAENVFNILATYNKISFTKEDEEKYLNLVKAPEDYQTTLNDLKVLGRRELQSLLKWRGKLLKKVQNQARQARQKEDLNGMEEEAEEYNTDSELEDEVRKAQMKDLKEKRREREKKIEQIAKVSMNDSANVFHNDAEVEFDDLEELDEDLEDIDYIDIDSENEEEKKKEDLKNKESKFKSNKKTDIEDNIEHIFELKQERRKQIEANINKKRKKKLGIEDDDAENDEEDDLGLDTFDKNQNIEDIQIAESKLQLHKSKWYDKQIFKDVLSLNEFDTLPKIVNPIKLQKEKEHESSDEDFENGHVDQNYQNGSKLSDEEFDDDNAEEDFILPKPKSDREKRKEKLKKEAERKALKEKKGKGEDENAIEIVPRKNLEDYDIDDLATTRALALKMLREKDREKIIEDSYNRYSRPENEDLPEWFAEDERRHNMKILPITKEEYQAEKMKLMQIKNKPIKKVAEAKFKQKMKLSKRLQKAKGKAKQILDQEGVSESTKLKQVHNLYKKEMANNKREKKYVVSRKHTAQKQKNNVKAGRFQKVVDKRLKKDKRADKRRIINERGKKIKKSKKRHVKRR